MSAATGRFRHLRGGPQPCGYGTWVGTTPHVPPESPGVDHAGASCFAGVATARWRRSFGAFSATRAERNHIDTRPRGRACARWSGSRL